MARTLMIIPALDEELALPKVLADLRATLPEADVVVVEKPTLPALSM